MGTGSRRSGSVYNSRRNRKLRKTPLAEIYLRVPRIMKRMEQNREINKILIERTKPSERMQNIIINATRMDDAGYRVSAAGMLKTVAERLLTTDPKYAAIHKDAIKEIGKLTLNDIANVMGSRRTDPDSDVQTEAVETIKHIDKAAPIGSRIRVSSFS